MTWTYNVNDLATNEVDQIRLEVSDTDENNQLLQNEEIEQAINVEANYWAAAARCSEFIARGFLRKADIKLGRAMMITYTKMAQQYLDMAVKLRQKALGCRVPWVGGMSVTDKLVYLQNADIVAAIWSKNMQENPWTGGYTSDSLPPVGNTAQGLINGLDEEQIT